MSVSSFVLANNGSTGVPTYQPANSHTHATAVGVFCILFFDLHKKYLHLSTILAVIAAVALSVEASVYDNNNTFDHMFAGLVCQIVAMYVIEIDCSSWMNMSTMRCCSTWNWLIG